MFYVYGVTMKDCIKQAKKKLLELKEPMSQSQADTRLIEIANEIFKTAKPKCISGELSCPQRVKQFIELASKDKSVRELKPMKKVQKLDGQGEPILTKKLVNLLLK
jgi:hypothetical protein